MSNRRFPQSRAERIIALGRFVLAVASFGAIYFDPHEPARLPMLAYSLLTAYSAYALIVLLHSLTASTASRRGQILSHVADLVFFGTLNALIFGPNSLFFTFFVFSILCAMLRFGRRGTILTAALAMVVFIASSVPSAFTPGFELNRFLIRVTYLLVLASMLVYLATYQERIQHDLQRIAAWPRSSRRDYETLLAELLSEAASIFGARRVLLVYRYLSERVAYLYTAADGGSLELQPREIADLLAVRDGGTYFSSAAYPTARLDSDDSIPRSRISRETPRGLRAELVARYGIDAVITTSLKGDFVRGSMLLLDGPSPLLEEVNLARIAAAVVAGRLDHFYAAQQLQRGAVAEERVRVARDLHDSVLQSLTGVALQLRTLPRLMLRSPEETEGRLGQIEHVIASAQKELRWFIEELRPERTRRDDDILGERLTSLAKRFHEQWGLEVENEVAPVVHLLPIATRYEIYAIVNEAVANAARHAGAKRVAVVVDVTDDAVEIDIEDDGKGFPFHGRYDLRSLVDSNIGPVTLKERVNSLGGSMIIDSSDGGAKLEIRMPLREAGV